MTNYQKRILTEKNFFQLTVCKSCHHLKVAIKVAYWQIRRFSLYYYPYSAPYNIISTYTHILTLQLHSCWHIYTLTIAAPPPATP